MGFISTVGATRTAAAWTACERPTSPPSGVTSELEDMFCAFEWGNLETVLGEDAAQCRSQDGLARMGRSSLHHDDFSQVAATHSPALPVAPLPAGRIRRPCVHLYECIPAGQKTCSP